MPIEVITPRDRAAWLKVRGRDITASTVGALFDAHEWMTVYELWALKSGRLPRDDEETPAIQRGRLLEPVAVQLLRETYPEWEITHNAAENRYYRDPDARLGATPDVLVRDPRRGFGVVQIKSVEAGVYRRKWVAEDTGEPDPPLWISLQALLEAHLTGARWAAVAPLVVSHGIDMPLIDIDLSHMRGVVDEITKRAAEFWQMVDEGREPVIDYARDGELIDRLYAVGDPREEVDLTGDLSWLDTIEDVQRLRAEIAAAEQEKASAEARIKAAMGTAEIAHVAGGRRITWKTQRRPGPDGRPIICRVLRLPKS